jgi:3D (Asp-Asp-Asp) domain-containing protein
MRKISIIVILTALLLIPFISNAKDIKNTKTKPELKIKNNIVYFQNIPVGYKSPKKEKSLSERDQLILERWKHKQLSKWDNLPKEKFTINASAYTAAADECGWNTGITASGVVVEENRTIACPPKYPFGTKVKIEGYGTYTCEDRGGAIKGNHFDIYMETKSEAFAFGRRNLTAEIAI